MRQGGEIATREQLAEEFKDYSDESGTRAFLFPGTNYCGPKNPIGKQYRKDYQPVNKSDEACMYHDMAYTKYGGDPKKIRESDLKLLADLNDADHNDVGNRASDIGIKLKIGVEKIPFVKDLIPKSHRGGAR